MKNKKIAIMLSIIMLLTVIFTTVLSYSTYAFSLEDMQKQAHDFESHGKGEADKIISTEDIENKIIPIGQVLVAIASFVLVIVTIIMAIKYLTSSPEQKGKLKQQLIGLVVSIVVIYGAVGIWSIMKSIMEASKL